jgi:hypothetical protein
MTYLNFPGFPPIKGVGEPITEIPVPDPDYCAACAPFACDDPDRHLGVPSEYTPLKNRGCRCGADFDGRDCMCFEDY